MGEGESMKKKRGGGHPQSQMIDNGGGETS